VFPDEALSGAHGPALGKVGLSGQGPGHGFAGSRSHGFEEPALHGRVLSRCSLKKWLLHVSEHGPHGGQM
jgi:hypothetical protein